jgi:uncharacterized protein (DUF169 family)
MSSIQETLGLSKAPIGVAFLDEPPAGVKQWSGGPVPAGCSFWREAMNGQTFYTVPADHYNCAVGAYTHNIEQPEERSAALNDTIGFMVGSGYLQMAEVPMIPVLPKTPRYVAYGPVADAKFHPDVVVITATPAEMMMIYEAALRSGAGSMAPPALGRPGCAILPLTLNSGASAFSFGCKGNRTFTGLPDSEMYISIPGAKWDAFVAAMGEIVKANVTMEAHYKAHEDAVKCLPPSEVSEG